MPESVITVRLDAEDLALLNASAAKEKLSKSDILRRGLRAYAANLGITPATVKPRRKSKR